LQSPPMSFDCGDLPDELIDELLADAGTPEEITGPDGLLQQLTKRLVERAMAAELNRPSSETDARPR